MTLAPLLARLERGFHWCVRKVKAAGRWLKRRFQRNQPGWATPSRDPAHAYYRTQYERLIEALPHLPRTPDNETNATFLAFAQVVQQLHELGDDPIMPPGVKRIYVRETQRLAQFGAVGQPRPLLGAVRAAAGGWQVWAIVGAIAVSGWGMAAVQAAIKERVENQRDEARAQAARMEASRNAYAQRLGEERAAHARDVAGVIENTARTVEQLQRRAARDRANAARERSRNEELNSNGTVDFRERLRELAEPADAGLPAATTPNAGGRPASGVPASTGRPANADPAE